MTNQNNNSKTAKRHREHRVLSPYGDGTQPHRVTNLLINTLASCEFMPFADGRFSDDTTYYLLATDVSRDIEPSFKLTLDNLDEMTESIGANKADLSLIISARSSHLKRYEALGQWKLDEVPSCSWSPKPEKLRKLQARKSMTFVIAIRVSNSTPELEANGLDIGKVLCRREFHVREPSDSGASFPFEWFEFGPPTDYPTELLWAIEWFDTDGDDNPYKRPVKEALIVRGNAKVEKLLLDMNRVQGARGLVWKSLASEIITDIWTTVITGCKDDMPDEEEDDATLAGQVFRRISAEADRPYEEIPDLIADAPDYTELRKIVAKAIKVVV